MASISYYMQDLMLVGSEESAPLKNNTIGSLIGKKLFNLAMYKPSTSKEVPVYINRRKYSNMRNIKDTWDNRTVIAPLIIDTTCNVMKKTFGSLIRYMSCNQYNKHLIAVSDYNGNIYYFGKGCILDHNFNPFVLTTYIPNDTNEWNYGFYATNTVLYVSPVVLTEQTTMSKGIIKYMFKEFSESRNSKVIIGNDINKFFLKPEIPSTNFTNSKLNAIISKTVDYVNK